MATPTYTVTHGLPAPLKCPDCGGADVEPLGGGKRYPDVGVMLHCRNKACDNIFPEDECLTDSHAR